MNKMHKKYSTLFLLGFFFLQYEQGFAQTNWFVKPMIQSKTAIAFVDPLDRSNSSENILENQTFYSPYAVNESARIIKNQALDIGLGFGFSYKNNTRKIQFLWNRDVARFRVSSLVRSYNDDAHSGSGISYFGITINRFSLNYSQRLAEKNDFVDSWFTLGLGTFLNFNSTGAKLGSEWENFYVAPDAQLKTIYLQSFEERTLNGLIKVGFENDLLFRNKYLFSLNAYYIQGIGTISRVVYGHEYSINNEHVIYHTGLISRGSGFYLELSRSFRVYSSKRPTH